MSDITEPVLGTAVVTGGAAGLGRAFAVALAQAGHAVAILDLAEASETLAEVNAQGVPSLSRVGDASDPAAVTDFAADVRRELPPVRVVVNNVGISPYAPFVDTDLNLWHRVMRVNLDSMYLVTQAFLPDLLAHGAGRVVNLTSTVVWDSQARDMVAYGTSKAAVVGFTRALAGEVGAHGVTVNAIAPGIVLTPDIVARVPAERLETYRGRQAVPVLAHPSDFTSAMLFLVSPASSQVTGTVLPINGGRVLL
ncbi:MAG: SDR family oxidoreductase [Actinobacteria bacterium]|nr:SDR family oxidoreductase [Actinomycetota bacterium]